MTIKNKNIGDKNRKISGKKIMLVTALLSGGVVIRVNNHINNSFGHVISEIPKEPPVNPPNDVIKMDLTLESTDVLIDEKGMFYVGQGTPIDNFDIADFVTILDEEGNVIPKSEVTLEWDIKEYFEGETFGTVGKYYITISATMEDGRMGELEYILQVKEGHIFEEVKSIESIEIDQFNTVDILDFQEHFKVLNSVTGADTGAVIQSTLEDEDLRNLGTKQVVFYTEYEGIRFTNSVHISVVDTVAPVIGLESSFNNGEGFEWDQRTKTINISELDKTLGDFTLDEYANAYDGSGEYELSWNFDEIMENKMDQIVTERVTIKAIDSSGNESFIEIFVNISTVKFELKDGISEIAFEIYHDAILEDAKYKVGAFYDIRDSSGNLILDPTRISWDLTEEMVKELGEYRLTIEVLDENKNKLIGSKGVTVKVQDTLAPEAILNPGMNTTFNIEVNQNLNVDNLFMYLNGISDIDELISVTENSGVWGYRFTYNGRELTDEMLRTTGSKVVVLEIFDYDINGEEANRSYLNDTNGQPLSIVFNIVDTTDPIVNVVNDVIDLEVVQNATKEMIEITNYAEIKDNSGIFTWDLRVKGSQDDVMDYADMLGKITDPAGVELELVVTDASGNTVYNDILLIVTDTTPPSIEVIKSEETININPTAGDFITIRNMDNYVKVSDNSRNTDVTWDFDQVVRQATETGVYYVTVTAKDNAGNVSEETITFTVVDNEAPVIIVNTKTIEIEANEYTNKDELEFDINLKDYITVTDNSNGLIDTSFDYSNVDFGAIGTYEVIITATDAAGNESTNVIQLKVIAGEPKVRVVNDKEIIDNVHIDSSNTISGIKIEVKDGKIVIERSSNPTDQADILTHLTMNNLLEFLTIDGETIESQSWDLTTIDFSTIGTYNIQLTVTNNFGKTATETIEFLVIQEYDSILELKGDNFIDLEIDASDTNRDVAWFESTYDENDYAKFIASGGSGTFVWDQSTLTNIDFDIVGSYVVTIYLDDGHADRKELTLSLNIIDTTGPVFTTVNDMETAGVNDKVASDYAFADFVTVSDNSGIAPTLSWNLDTQVDFTKVGTYVVTIKAVDAFGNETTKDITFEINDTEAPVLVLNPGMDIQTIEINSRDASSFNINSFVSVTDNSGVAPELEWNIDSVDFGTTGTYTIIIKATDSAKNESNEVTVTFEIVDTIAPSIDIDPSGLEELKVEIDTKSESDYSDWLEDYVTVTDNSHEDITPTWDITSVDFGTVGSYMIVISATDSSGHTTTTNVVFAVADTTAPTISLISGQETTEYEVFDSKLEDFKIADFATCDDATNCTISWDMSSVNFDRVGTYIVTIKAVDMYGNESVQEITIEVQDTTKPEIVITRPDILISMDKYTSSDFNVNDFATVTDNYDKSVVLTWNIDDVGFNTVGDYTVIISATDSSGNEAVEKMVLFKVEEFNITLTEVIPFVIEVDQANFEPNFNVNNYFTAKDQNGVAVNNIVWNLTDDMLKTYGTYAVMLTITFDTDKVIEMEVTLEVTDTTDPTVVVDTTTTTIELGDTAEFDKLNVEDFVIVIDNSNDVTYSWDFDNVVEQTIAGTYTVSITVTDVAGNETVVTTEIVVEDTVAPDLVLNDDFNRNNMIWSKSTAELTLLEKDKALGEIDLWELVTATDLSTGGLTISWNITEAQLNGAGHYTLDIEVSDGTLISTETITVNVLRPTPILNDFNVDKSYNDVTVNVDITNLSQAITSLVITLERPDGSVVDTYTQALSALDAYTINHVFNTGVTSNTEYKVVLEYVYETRLDGTDTTTITDTKDVKTLAYSQNDVLGTITDIYLRHEEITVNYELSNEFGLLSNAKIVLTDASNNPVEHQLTDMSTSSGTYTFTGLKSNTKYKIEIIFEYDFNDSKGTIIKVSDVRDVETLEYTEHDVIADITGITQSPSTISVDYNITDIYGLMVGTGVAKLYKADDMTTIVSNEVLLDLNGTIKFDNLLANTSYIVVIETSLDLVQDGTNTITNIKETGYQTTTEAYSVDEIVVNIENVIVEYNEITFDYSMFDPSGLLVNPTTSGVWLSINNDRYDLSTLSATVNLSQVLATNNEEVFSAKDYDIQIHFSYDLKDGLGTQNYTKTTYRVEETTFEYNVDQDLTLTSHNLASDTKTIYVDYSLRNLNNIGDMSTLTIKIDDLKGNSEEILLSTIFGDVASIPLEGTIVFYDVNNSLLSKDTEYEITMTIDYDLRDGNPVQQGLLLLDRAEIKTTDVDLAGYDIISSVNRGYTTIEVDFDIENINDIVDLSTLKIALLDEDKNIVQDYVSISNAHSGSGNIFLFENLLSDATYTVVFRVDHPNYGIDNDAKEFIEIERRTSTRAYDTSLIDVNYTLIQGLTFLHLENIEITNGNDLFEKIDYSSVIVLVSYVDRDGNTVTKEIDLGSLTEGEYTEAVFTGLQSSRDINIEFRLEYDLKDGSGVQSGSKELVRNSDTKTLEYDFTFVIENDEAVVTGLTPGFNDSHLLIFAEVDGYPVKHIKSDAFYGDSISFTEITIPRTLETIGNNSFRATNLTTVNLTNVFEVIPTLTPKVSNYTTQVELVIGDNAFRDNNITSFDFTTTESIGSSAFRNNNLNTVTLGDAVSYVGDEAFLNAKVTNLVTGTLLSDENFGANTFVGNEITDLTIGNVGFKHTSLGSSELVFKNSGFSLTYANSAIGEIVGNAWYHDVNDSRFSNVPVINVTVGDGITTIGGSAFFGNHLNSVTIGKNVEVLSLYAFSDTGINTLTFADGGQLKSIGYRAFYNNNIQKLVFPDTVEKIYFEAFAQNDIEELILPSNVNHVANGAFRDNGMTTLEVGELLSDENFESSTFIGNNISSLTIGNIGFRYDSLGETDKVFASTGYELEIKDTAVGTIDESAWRYGTGYSPVPITKVTIGHGITEIGAVSFLGNTLDSVEIGDGVVNIGSSAFYKTGIKTVTFGKSLETINASAFSENQITSLTIPDYITYVGTNAFVSNNIEYLNLGASLTPGDMGNNAFYDNNIKTLLIGSTEFVHDSFGNSRYVFSTTDKLDLTYLDTTVGSIPDAAWEYGTSASNIQVSSLTMGDKIESIGNDAFANNNITGVLSLSLNINNIGENAFLNNNISGELLLSNKITNIGVGAFLNNGITGSMKLPDALISIGNNAFSNNSIASLEAGNVLASIGTSAFSSNNIATINLGDSLETIGSNAFVDNSIVDLVIPNSTNTLGASAFKNNNISTIQMSNNITRLNNYVFENNNLTQFVIPNQVTYIGQSAFANNTLEEVTIHSNISTVGISAFANNGAKNGEKGLSTVVVEDGVSLSAFASNTFTGNNISELTLNSLDFKHDSFGSSADVFDANGFELIYGDGAQGVISTEYWRYVSGVSGYLNSQIIGLTIGDNITEIGESAFLGNDLNIVVIGDGVETIGDSAFNRAGITQLTLGSGLERIGEASFNGNSIKDLKIPNSVQSLGTSAFSTNSMVTLDLGDNLKVSNIGSTAFRYNDITDLTVGDSGFKYDSLGDSSEVFSDTENLTLTYNETAIGTIPANAWRYGTGYSSVKVDTLKLSSGIETIQSNAFSYNDLSSGFTIPNSVESINTDAFKSSNIGELTFESVENSLLTSVGSGAFDGNKLTSVTLPDGVQTIGASAFANNGISSFDFGTTVLELSDSVLANNKLVNVIISDGITKIGNNAFEGNGTTTVEIPDSVTSIGSAAFATNDITELKIPNSVTYLGARAFLDNEISTLTLSENITEIYSSTFQNNNLTVLEIDDQIESIGISAFSGNMINSLVLPSTLDYVGTSAFANNTARDGNPGLEKVVISDGLTVSDFGANSFLGNDISDITFGNIGFEHDTLGESSSVFASTGFKLTYSDAATGAISNDMWRYVNSSGYLRAQITDLVLGNGITSIGSSAFQGNSNINKAVIGDNVLSISSNAFYSTGLNELELGSKLKTIGENAFNINDLVEVVIPNSVTSIGENAFANNDIKKLKLSDSLPVSNIGSNSFLNNSINDLTVGKNNFKHNTLGVSDDVFDNSGFKLTYSDAATGAIADETWRYANGASAYLQVEITGLTIGDGITSIGESAFQGNEIGVAVIGNGVTFIDGYAFNGAGITDLTLGNSVKTISLVAFNNNDIKTLVIPSSVTAIGRAAFNSNSNMTEVTFMGGRVINGDSSGTAFVSGVVFKNASGGTIT